MNFSKLHLSENRPQKKSEQIREYFSNLISDKETIHMLENSRSDWRKEIQEEHPYVEVMPGGDDDIHPKLKNDIKNKHKRKEESKNTLL